MVTTIGTSTDKIRIGDNATPGSGTYEWFLNGNASEKDPQKKTVAENLVQDNSIVYDGYTLAGVWMLDSKLKTNTEYLNLRKARLYWAANNSLLYLSVKNELSADELAVVAAFATPTTLTQFTGQLSEWKWVPLSTSHEVSTIMKYFKEAT